MQYILVEYFMAAHYFRLRVDITIVQFSPSRAIRQTLLRVELHFSHTYSYRAVFAKNPKSLHS